MERMTKEVLRRSLLLVGRRRLYRASRFLMRATRGDVANCQSINGERTVQTVALRTSVSSSTIFDVGANVGNWTASLLEIAESVGIGARVHAFEPCAGTFARLSERFGKSPQISLINRACSRHAGIATMHVYGSGAGTNSLVDPIDDLKAAVEEVQLTTIDLYCQNNAINAIDLLKIDAEGHDFEVMCGASEMLNRQAVRILQFEYNQRWIGCRNYLRDVFSFLTPKGYAIGKLTGSAVEFYPGWHWELENWWEGNFIACAEHDMRQFPCRKPTWLDYRR